MNKFGLRIRFFDTVTSTQDVAKDIARQGADNDGTVVVAREMTKGRGRLGRVWHSPIGGLWFSVILRPDVSPAEAPTVTLLAAVGVARALRELYPVDASIKWPNDILIKSKKVCGILTEASVEQARISFVVLGIGINANVDVGTFPSGLLMPATSLSAEIGRKVDLNSLLASCLNHLEAEYALFNARQFDEILNNWRELSGILGKRVKVSAPTETLVGIAEDIDQSGALILLLPSGERRVVQVGDLLILEK